MMIYAKCQHVSFRSHDTVCCAVLQSGRVINFVALQEKLNLPCIYSPAVQEVMRGIRAHVDSLITGWSDNNVNNS